jgi:hypothetical protein
MDFTTLGSLISGFCSAVFYSWLSVLTMPFWAFTFTDPANFILTALIPLTLLAIAWQQLWRPNSLRWIWFATKATYTLAVMGPLIPLTALYLASWRASGVLGHWPQSPMDDPSVICKHDALYQMLHAVSVYSVVFGSWSIFCFGALVLNLRRQVSPVHLRWMAFVFFVS